MPPPSGAAPPQSRADRRRVGLPALAIAAILLGVALGAAVVWSAGWRGGLSYADIPVAELPLPSAGGGPAATAGSTGPVATLPAEHAPSVESAHAGHPSPSPGAEVKAPDPHPPGPGQDGRSAHLPAAPSHAAPAATAHGGSPPAEPDPALLEQRGGTWLPTVAADGRKPRRVYARSAATAAGGDGPRVAVLVTGVGLAREVSEAALRLPADVTVAVSVHADDVDGWLRRARAGGREAMLTLPLEPVDPTRVDPGPGALGLRQDGAAREAALAALLGRGAGYAGLVADPGAFAGNPDVFAPVAKELARRGLALVELGGSRLARVAKAGGLPHVGTGPALDEAPSAARVDLALGALEAAALREGTAVGWARGYPVALERLAAWAETLADKGLRLVPASALLPEPAGDGAAGEAAAAATR